MIQAIIFDCYGVLTTDGWLPFKNKYFGHDDQLMRRASDLNQQSDAGLISYDDFLSGVAQMARIPISEAASQIENNVPNEALLDLITGYKANYKIGMLSNAASNILDEMFTPDQLTFFDAVCLSYETGVIKPQTEAYQTIADRLGVDPKDCVFIDDQQRYCTGASDVGMSSIWYKDVPQMQAELDALLVPSASA